MGDPVLHKKTAKEERERNWAERTRRVNCILHYLGPNGATAKDGLCRIDDKDLAVVHGICEVAIALSAQGLPAEWGELVREQLLDRLSRSFFECRPLTPRDCY